MGHAVFFSSIHSNQYCRTQLCVWVGVFFKVAILPTICASLSLSLPLSLTHTRECFKPAFGNKPRSTNLCRDSAKPCLGRNIIKTHLCCHGNRDLNKFISCVCFFTACLAFTWFIGWVEWVAELHAVPIPLLLVARVYLFSYQTSWMIIFHHHSCCSRVQFCLCLFVYL